MPIILPDTQEIGYSASMWLLKAELESAHDILWLQTWRVDFCVSLMAGGAVGLSAFRFAHLLH